MNPARHRTWMRRCGEGMKWAVPGAILILLPKCPACLAAYLAVGTGLGLSLPVAGAVRWTLMAACISALAYLVIQRVRHARRPRISQNHC